MEEVLPDLASDCLLADEEGSGVGEDGIGGNTVVIAGEYMNSKQRSLESFIIADIASRIGASFALGGAGGGSIRSPFLSLDEDLGMDFSATTKLPKRRARASRIPASTSILW